MIIRGGRGDRIGRYGNNSNEHNFLDMDYRGYEQEDEEAGPEDDGLYSHHERPPGAHDFPADFPHDGARFHHRGNARGNMGRDGKGLLWPPFSHSHPDVAHPIHQRENGPRRESELPHTCFQERGRQKSGRGFLEKSVPHSESRESHWSHVGTHPEQMLFGVGRQREEDRFSRGTGRRRVSHRFMTRNIFFIIVCLTMNSYSTNFITAFSGDSRGARMWKSGPRSVR